MCVALAICAHMSYILIYWWENPQGKQTRVDMSVAKKNPFYFSKRLLHIFVCTTQHTHTLDGNGKYGNGSGGGSNNVNG